MRHALLVLLFACNKEGGSGGPTSSDPADSADLDDTHDTSEDTGEPPRVGVTLRRTAHGVAHVTADDLYGLGYGVGYAYTEDNACQLAWRVAEVSGRLSAQIGADGEASLPVHGVTWSALDSDRFFQAWLGDDAIAAGFAAGSEEVTELAQGYADGINRFVAAHGALTGCPVQFTAEVTRSEVYRMWVATALVASGEVLAPYLATEAPTAVAPLPARPRGPLGRPLAPFGSNAWALGRDATQDGSGVHLYNPHFPWKGIHRVYLVHLTIPGELDVMGPALGGLPLPAAGFNADVAWGLTFSTAARFTLAELPLVAGDPMSYTVDGETMPITEERHSIEVAGESSPREVSTFRTPQGLIIDAGAFQLGWTPTTAFAAQDVNEANTRFVEQLLGLARARTVGEVQASLAAVQGMPWSYTSAVDRAGDVFFGDLSNVPNVDNALLDDCNHSETAEALRPAGIYVLDGGRAACGWAGSLSADELPSVLRSDYVANSNNTHELPNLNTPLTGYSGILGEPEAALDLRPTLGLRMIEDRIAGTDGLGAPGFTAELTEQLFHQTRGLAGELLAAPIAAECLTNPTGEYRGAAVDLTAVCTALSTWDGRYGTESVGALVFDGLWVALNDSGDALKLFETPADWADPQGTPAGYTESALQRSKVHEALARVALALDEAGLSATSPWGEAHTIAGPEGLIGVPGGSGNQGVFDVLESAANFGTWRGWTAALSGTAPEDLFGSSYLHVVRLDADGPAARGLLSYSQATEADSPWYLDQLGALSEGDWFDLPFTEAQITADPALVEVSL